METTNDGLALVEPKTVFGYRVASVTLDQLDAIRDADLESREFTYALAVACVTKDGKAINRADLGKMPAGIALRVLQAVNDMNLPPKPDSEGN